MRGVQSSKRRWRQGAPEEAIVSPGYEVLVQPGLPFNLHRNRGWEVLVKIDLIQ